MYIGTVCVRAFLATGTILGVIEAHAVSALFSFVVFGVEQVLNYVRTSPCPVVILQIIFIINKLFAILAEGTPSFVTFVMKIRAIQI